MYKELQKLKEWGNNKIYTSVKVSMLVRKAVKGPLPELSLFPLNILLWKFFKFTAKLKEF